MGKILDTTGEVIDPLELEDFNKDNLPVPARSKEITSFEPTENERMLTQIINAGMNPDFDAGKMKAMLDMHSNLLDRDAKQAYANAMAEFNKIKEVIQTNRKGKGPGQSVFPYADYPKLVKAVTPWLSKCGLSFDHFEDPPVMTDESKVSYVMVHCKIMHIKGHSETFSNPAMPNPLVADKLSPNQAIQQGITYSKRTTLSMGLGIATAEDVDDDDSCAKSAKITDEQVANLKASMEEWIINHPKFLKFIGVKKVEDMTIVQFKAAIKHIDVIKSKA